MALVTAAALSHRYLTDRFLPDKAIDLVDEAASRSNMEQDSKPTGVCKTETTRALAEFLFDDESSSRAKKSRSARRMLY